MTMQTPEILYIDRKQHNFYEDPLDYYWNKKRIRPEFEVPHTACWRGYEARWSLRDDKLFLTSIKAQLRNGTKYDVKTMFNTNKRRVFADWFTGEIRIANPGSGIIGSAFTSMCADLTVFRFKNGKLIDKKILKSEDGHLFMY